MPPRISAYREQPKGHHRRQRTKSKELPSRAVCIRNYLAVFTQRGARTALHLALPRRPAGGANLIDSESSDDGVLLSARKEQVGDALHTRHYIAPHRYHVDPSAGTVPAGYRPVTIAGIPCYSNQLPPPFVVPHPLSFPGGGLGTRHLVNPKFSLRLIVLLCG